MICPPACPATQLFVDRHFHLKPIAHLLGASPLLGVVLVDRHRARIFDLRLGELTEREGPVSSACRAADAATASPDMTAATPSAAWKTKPASTLRMWPRC